MPKTKSHRVVDTFLKLVQISSPTGHEQKMSKEVSWRLEKLGVETETDSFGNVLAKLKGDPKKESFMLNAHLDTVEPGRKIVPYISKSGWIKSKGKTILGADNKTAVAAILETVQRLVEEKITDHHPLEIVFTTSEESGGYGAIGLNYSKVKSRVGYSFDVANANFGDIIISAPFYSRVDIKIEGKSVHAKSPELGVNVLPIFAKAIGKIKLGRISKNSLANIGIVRAGNAVNSVPGEMTIAGDIRSTVEGELQEVGDNIKRVFKSEARKEGAKAWVRVTQESSGYKLKRDDKLIKRTIGILNSFDVKPKLINSLGCADANTFAEHGIKMLSIADGSLGTHTKDEKIKVSDLIKLPDLIYSLVIN